MKKEALELIKWARENMRATTVSAIADFDRMLQSADPEASVYFVSDCQEVIRVLDHLGRANQAGTWASLMVVVCEGKDVLVWGLEHIELDRFDRAYLIEPYNPMYDPLPQSGVVG